jgi:transcriptional regulator with XRE-family HTH domain
MSIENIKKRILKEAIVDTQWLERAQWRIDNEDWLDLSFEIAVKIGSVLSKNKALDKFPKNQKELAEAMGVSPQYVNKVIKGSENLQLDTITKIQNILGVKLIEIAKNEKQKTMVVFQKTFELSYQDLTIIYDGNEYNKKELVNMLIRYKQENTAINIPSVSSKHIYKFLESA